MALLWIRVSVVPQRRTDLNSMSVHRNFHEFNERLHSLENLLPALPKDWDMGVPRVAQCHTLPAAHE
jgi:hypothetical protein